MADTKRLGARGRADGAAREQAGARRRPARSSRRSARAACSPSCRSGVPTRGADGGAPRARTSGSARRGRKCGAARPSGRWRPTRHSDRLHIADTREQAARADGRGVGQIAPRSTRRSATVMITDASNGSSTASTRWPRNAARRPGELGAERVELPGPPLRPGGGRRGDLHSRPAIRPGEQRVENGTLGTIAASEQRRQADDPDARRE